MKTLIKNAWILTMDEALSTYPKGMLVIKNNQISYVGEYKAEMEQHVDEIIDAAGGLLIPGMINTLTQEIVPLIAEVYHEDVN